VAKKSKESGDGNKKPHGSQSHHREGDKAITKGADDYQKGYSDGKTLYQRGQKLPKNPRGS
jgi:Ni/Co efflux regulator RcnB